MTKPLCIYHGNCADGFTAAWAVWKFFKGEVDFHAGVHGEPPPEVSGRDVIIVDFSYKPEILIRMALEARSVLLLDHHKSAKEAVESYEVEGRVHQWQVDMSQWTTPLSWDRHMVNVYQDQCEGVPNLVYTVFDMERSGAMITWDFFFDEPAPKFIEYIQDRDLWKFNLKGTADFQAYVFSYPYDFEIWDHLISDLSPEDMIDEGLAIQRKHIKDIKELVEVMKRPMLIGGHVVWCVNLPYTMASDACHILCSTPFANGDLPAFGASYYDKHGVRVFSLRSVGDFDVSKIAAGYGGGGHKNAAGFGRELGWEGDT